jgi:hypothetical protein
MGKNVERAIQGSLEQGLLTKPLRLGDIDYRTTLDTERTPCMCGWWNADCGMEKQEVESAIRNVQAVRQCANNVCPGT